MSRQKDWKNTLTTFTEIDFLTYHISQHMNQLKVNIWAISLGMVYLGKAIVLGISLYFSDLIKRG